MIVKFNLKLNTHSTYTSVSCLTCILTCKIVPACQARSFDQEFFNPKTRFALNLGYSGMDRIWYQTWNASLGTP